LIGNQGGIFCLLK